MAVGLCQLQNSVRLPAAINSIPVPDAAVLIRPQRPQVRPIWICAATPDLIAQRMMRVESGGTAT